MLPLSEKIALVTGASRGIGKGIAQQLWCASIACAGEKVASNLDGFDLCTLDN